MIRAAIVSLLTLTGCAVPSSTVRTETGQAIDAAYLILAPLCLFICPVTVTTTGSDVKTLGAGATSSTNQTSSVATGAITGGN